MSAIGKPLTTRKRALDKRGVERAEKGKSRRVTPSGAAFTSRVLYRDMNGNAYAEPPPSDLHAQQITHRSRHFDGRLLFVRPAARRDRGIGMPNLAAGLRRGDTIRLLNLATRIESVAEIADVMTRSNRQNSYGYVVLINMIDISIVVEPQLYNKTIPIEQ